MATRVECTAAATVDGVMAEPWVEISAEVGNARLRSGVAFIWLQQASVEVAPDSGGPTVDIVVKDAKQRAVKFTLKKSLWTPKSGTGFQATLSKTIADLSKPSMRMRLLLRKKLVAAPKEEPAPPPPPVLESPKKETLLPFGSPVRNKKVSILNQSPSRVHPRLSMSPSSPRKQPDPNVTKSPFRSPFGKKAATKRFLSPSAAHPTPTRAKTFDEVGSDDEIDADGHDDCLDSPSPVRRVRRMSDRMKDLEAMIYSPSKATRLAPMRLQLDMSPPPVIPKPSPGRRLPPKLVLETPPAKLQLEMPPAKAQRAASEPTSPPTTPKAAVPEDAVPLDAAPSTPKTPEPAIATPKPAPETAPTAQVAASSEVADAAKIPEAKDGFSQLLIGAKKQAALAKSQGLVNLGNTCYMNAVLQALLSLQGFVQVLRDDAWVAIVTKHPLPKGHWGQKSVKDAYELYLCFKEMIKGHGESSHLDPGPMKAVVGKRAQAFANNAQQDAHEFLMNVLHELEEDMKAIVAAQLAAQSTDAAIKKASKQSLHQYFATTTPADDRAQTDCDAMLPTTTYFQTTVTQTLSCTSCGYSRHVDETFRELSLDFPPAAHARSVAHCKCQKPTRRFITKKEGRNKDRPFFKCAQFPQCDYFEWDDSPPVDVPALTVPQLLATHFEPHTVDLKCERCDAGTSAKVTARIKTAPPVLVLHLKRFEISTATMSLVKRNDVVTTPVTVDLDAFCGTPKPATSTYRIKSIIRHLGRSAGEGHYVTDVQGEKNLWTRYNDALVTEVEASAVLSGSGAETGYLLFYVRDKRV
ncbi:ubiquitin-specific protease [Achlya hypogyna]|uniref:Ubiquitin-specific protease n=1 Tax=Achlya hypogyna TaxID=1202772 RepID=A0A1V9Y9L8_ACHHY|nr:ubiquitin-specific protease [Achlya hypogyna]